MPQDTETPGASAFAVTSHFDPGDMFWVLWGPPGGPYHRRDGPKMCLDCPPISPLFSPAAKDIDVSTICSRCAPETLALAESLHMHALRPFGPADTLVCVVADSRWRRNRAMTATEASLDAIEMTGVGTGCAILATLRSWPGVTLVPHAAIEQASQRHYTFESAAFCLVPAAIAAWLEDLHSRTIRHRLVAEASHFTSSNWTVTTLPNAPSYDELVAAGRIATAVWEPGGVTEAADPITVLTTALSVGCQN